MFQGVKTVGTIGGFVKFVRRFIVSFVLPDESAALVAAGIMVIVATLTKRNLMGAYVVVSPESCSTFPTAYRKQIETVGTQSLPVKFPTLILREFATADMAGKVVFHKESSFQFDWDRDWCRIGSSVCSGAMIC